MRDLFLFHRERVATGAVVAALLLLAAFALTRLTGGGGAETAGTSMRDLLPLTEAEFQRALATAVEHGRAMGTFAPEAPEEDYFDRLGETAAPEYARHASVEGSAAGTAVRRLAEWGRPTSGVAEVTGAPMIATALVTLELSLRAEETASAGRDFLDLGDVQVSLREDGGEWLVIGVTDTERLEELRNEGVL
ncbi:hypothetical protein NI17_017210 [Thermobifida halotolerans]|uniref:Uncharacterized protein n=1 Tax=Thermobifida halotolerans TaxID=483545 RepID=A0A399G1P6_9ACTN|nr:hypothetical protein [Thermobifida halotolerans]UOE18544.1 hypothetical protein NI17_017210 [Thermobifida halotolerans]